MIIIWIIIGVIVVGGGIYLVAHSMNKNLNTNTNTNTAVVNQNTNANSANRNTNSNSNGNTNTALKSSVSISNFAFVPVNLTIKEGTTVTFTNNDSVAHTVVGDNFTSGNIAPGASYSHTFSSTGVFSYHCSIHPSMTGTITVQS